MSAHPQTGIVWATDRFITVWKDGRQDPAPVGVQWPRADGGPIIGDTPLKWYVIRESDPPILPGPQFEAIQAQDWDLSDFQNPAAGCPSGVATREWLLVQRPEDAQRADLERVYRAVITYYYPDSDFPGRQARFNDAVLARASQLPLTQDQLAAIAENQAFLSVQQSADQRKSEIEKAIVAGSPYELFDQWQLDRETVERLFHGVV